jgi:hypothetical protein
LRGHNLDDRRDRRRCRRVAASIDQALDDGLNAQELEDRVVAVGHR